MKHSFFTFDHDTLAKNQYTGKEIILQRLDTHIYTIVKRNALHGIVSNSMMMIITILLKNLRNLHCVRSNNEI